jgi:hypothetical protein
MLAGTHRLIRRTTKEEVIHDILDQESRIATMAPTTNLPNSEYPYCVARTDSSRSSLRRYHDILNGSKQPPYKPLLIFDGENEVMFVSEYSENSNCTHPTIASFASLHGVLLTVIFFL